MTFLRPLRVVATVAVLAVGCTVEEDGGSLSASASVTQSAGDSSSSGGGSTSAGSSGGTTGAASSSGEVITTSEPGTTTLGPTTGDPTTGSATTGEATTGVSTTTGNPGGCGDGVINGNEQCDGANLNGFTCEALGNAGGTLLCDSMTCTFDTQMCEVGGGDTSAGTSG